MANSATQAQEGSLPKMLVDEAPIQEHLHDVVRRKAEETVNALLDAQADDLWGANR